MDAAIEKILSDNIDVNPEEVPDFREGESGSDGEGDSDVVSSEEEEEEESGEDESGDESEEEESEADDDEEQEALDADLAGPDATESDEELNVHGEDVSQDNSGAEEKIAKPAGFLDGGKSDTFARAFARIMDTPAPKTEVLGAPILAGSKSIAARKAEDEAEAKADREAKKLRIEMKQRGHAVPKRRGEDPAADAQEKILQKTATRGVVRLFNAVAKAQRRLRDEEGATGSRAKAAKLGKASFLAELRNSRATTGATEAVVPSARAPSAAAEAQAQAHAGGSASDEEGGAGWAVLQEGFTGLQGGSKMKDWDRQMSEEESEEGGEGAGDSSGDDSD